MKKSLLFVIPLALLFLLVFPVLAYSVIPTYQCNNSETGNYVSASPCVPPDNLFSMTLCYSVPVYPTRIYFVSSGTHESYYSETFDGTWYGTGFELSDGWNDITGQENNRHKCWSVTTGDKNNTMELLRIDASTLIADRGTTSALNASLTRGTTGAVHAVGSVLPLGVGFLATATLLLKGVAWFKGIAGLETGDEWLRRRYGNTDSWTEEEKDEALKDS